MEERAFARDGIALAIRVGMTAVQPLNACVRVERPADTRLGKYQSLVVAAAALLTLMLASVPDVALAAR
jgi:hypothetical protein